MLHATCTPVCHLKEINTSQKLRAKLYTWTDPYTILINAFKYWIFTVSGYKTKETGMANSIFLQTKMSLENTGVMFAPYFN